MENLERIIAKIVEEANNKAKFILDDASKNSSEILSKAKAKLQNNIKELEKEYEIIEKSELERIKSGTALKSRNIILEAKQESIKTVFEKLNDIIKELSYEDMKNYILKTLNTRNIQEGETLYIPKRYEGLDLGREYQLTDKIQTGFMIEKNGIYENYTLESIINSNKDDIEVKIQEQLLNN